MDGATGPNSISEVTYFVPSETQYLNQSVSLPVLLWLCRSLASGAEETRQCSLYMKELDQFVSRAANTYLAQFICTDFIIHR